MHISPVVVAKRTRKINERASMKTLSVIRKREKPARVPFRNERFFIERSTIRFIGHGRRSPARHFSVNRSAEFIGIQINRMESEPEQLGLLRRLNRSIQSAKLSRRRFASPLALVSSATHPEGYRAIRQRAGAGCRMVERHAD